MTHTLRLLPVAALAIAAAGCLQVETNHSLYLSPDGGVSWMVEEKGVYSDDTNAATRQTEEDSYLVAARGGTHRMALGLTALGPGGPVRTHVLRNERPFHVLTEARFDAVERMLERLFEEGGLPARVTLDRSGDEATLRIVFDFSEHTEERESPASALLEDFDKYRFVLTDGEWGAAAGFDLDKNVATVAKEWLESGAEGVQTDGSAELVLRWKR